ncbi:hypothetical protein V2J09_014849 [Rumex salicifolius]
MHNLTFDAYRFSISWSRIFPEGTGEVNLEGVEYYNSLINYMLEKGITPYANLYHYDLPLALEKKYMGLLNRKVVLNSNKRTGGLCREDFADYADFCFKTFGDRVKNWMTFNEPRVIAALGYDNGLHAPGRCSKAYGNCSAGNSATEPYIVAHNLILAHASAVQRYREKYQTQQKGRIGILLDIYTSFYMYNPPSPKKPNPTGYQEEWHVGFAYEKNGVPIGPKANSYWLYEVPWGMYKTITYIKERYGNPTVILSENGMDDPGNVTLTKGLHDTERINYYKSYLTELKKAIDKGANTLKRYPKMSSYWFKKLLSKNQELEKI